MSNKKSIITLGVLLALVLTFVYGREQFAAIFDAFFNPSVKIMNAMDRTMSANSGEMKYVFDVDQNGVKVGANLDMKYERANEKVGKMHMAGTGSAMGVSLSAEGWVDYDLTDVNEPKIVAVGKLPVLSKFYVFDSKRFDVNKELDGFQSDDAENAALKSIFAKHFRQIKWTKNGESYGVTFTEERLNTLASDIITDIIEQGVLAEKKDELTAALEGLKSAKGYLGDKGLEIVVTLSGKDLSKIAFSSEILVKDISGNATPLSKPKTTTLVGSVEFTNIGQAQQISMPDIGADNVEYYEQLVDPNDVILYVNGKKADFEQSGIIESDMVMLPARALIEKLGGQMQYREEADGRRLVTGTLASNRLVLELDTVNAWSNGEEVELAVKPVNRDDTIYLPARFIAESFGKTVTSYKNLSGKTIVEITD